MTRIRLEQIRDCLEGGVPATIATCGEDGLPNASLLTHVQYVDGDHVALTYQFFNKTRHNILANPYAMVQVMDPVSAMEFRLTLRYLRTETSGPLFEAMRARLAGIAAHAHMQDVFVLRGADLYRVLDIEAVDDTGRLPCPGPRPSLLPAVRRICDRLSRCPDLDDLIDTALDGMTGPLGLRHVMMFIAGGGPSAAAPPDRLYALSSRGFDTSGAGFEVGMQDGIVGVAARERVPIRITNVAAEYSYSRAAGGGPTVLSVIPFPGRTPPGSQMAVPVQCGQRLLGVLYAESAEEWRFCYDDEDALATVAAHLGVTMALLEATASPADPGPARICPHGGGAPVTVRYYPVDDSVFIDGDYLIKGIAGAILSIILRDHLRDGRCDFTNRELRLHPDLRLPEVSDNLEARLILLQRRLTDRSDALRLQKTGRGRLRLVLRGPVTLETVG